MALPPSSFFVSVLDYYGLQPHNLGPNSILYLQPKLAGTDTILCWLKRRVQPLRKKNLLCTYSGNRDDPLRVSKDDLTNDAFLMRFKKLLKERTQFTEYFPMYTSINKPPPVSVLYAYVSCICLA